MGCTKRFYSYYTTYCYNCKARQCSPLRRNFMECSIINSALSLLMKYLVFGQREKLLISRLFIGHHTVVWSPLDWSAFRTHEGSTFTEKDRNRLNYRIGPNHRIGQSWCGPCIAAIAGYILFANSHCPLLPVTYINNSHRLLLAITSQPPLKIASRDKHYRQELLAVIQVTLAKGSGHYTMTNIANSHFLLLNTVGA